MSEFQEKLKRLMDEYAHLVYKLTKGFPDQEKYGSVSQWRRAALSVALNYIEGYARRKSAVQLNFLEISYGSLKESKYLSKFSYQESFINNEEYNQAQKLEEEIGAMIWKEITDLERSIY